METILRPAHERDLPSLTRLVGTIADGLTTLPNDPDFLAQKIHDSQRAFYPAIHKPGAEHYLFVLEDLASGQVVGTSGLIARVGGFEPFFTYEVRQEAFRHTPLGIAHEIPVLHLKERHDGPAEVCSLFLHPDFRRDGIGRLLSLARFLFIRAFPQRFATEVIAELRGYLDPGGRSPFWEAVAAPFFKKDYYTADILSGVGEKAFIQALMPRHPLYLNLLPREAQDVIGQVHHDTAPALRLLEHEGFSRSDEVDIFDAGPLVKAPRDAIRTVREALTRTVALLPPKDQRPHVPMLVSNRSLDFRAGRAVGCYDDSTLWLDPADAAALALDAGASADVLPVRR